MIKLDEPGKFKWVIKYQILDSQNICTLVEGRYFEHVPRKGDNVLINGVMYTANQTLYDFDNGVIMVPLIPTNENIKRPVDD